MKCLRCDKEMEYLKDYRFDSQDNNRGLLKALFDVEERLVLRMYVCRVCGHVEFFYLGAQKGVDWD